MTRLSLGLFAITAIICLSTGVTPTRAATETVVYSFCSQQYCMDGSEPMGTLLDVKGTLYGTTEYGGDGHCLGGCGTVFSVNSQTGAQKALYSFCNQPNCADGTTPVAGLIDVDGMLYGTTPLGGNGSCFGTPPFVNCGTLFRLDPKTGAETVVYSFCSQQDCTDGAYPHADLIDVNGILYGTTEYGGTGSCQSGVVTGCGTVFALDLQSGTETVLYSFQNSTADGQYPEAGLLAVKGTLYGTTARGGAGACPYGSGCGTVFSLNPNTGIEIMLHSFQQNCSDGIYPVGNLVNLKGTLYGTTGAGGSCNNGEGQGTVYTIDPATGAESIAYVFGVGAYPQVGLIDVKGTLYGTTEEGGAHNEGAAFSFNPITGTATAIYSFCSEQYCTDGMYPNTALLNVKGALYGTTMFGGADAARKNIGSGTVFKIEP